MFFLLFYFSQAGGETALGTHLKVVQTERRRCEGVNMAAKNTVWLAEKVTSGPLEGLNVMA